MSALKPYLCSEREVLNGLYIVRGKTRPYTHAAPRYTILASKARKQAESAPAYAGYSTTHCNRPFNARCRPSISRRCRQSLKPLEGVPRPHPRPARAPPPRRAARAASRARAPARSRSPRRVARPPPQPRRLARISSGTAPTVSAAPIVTVGAAPIVRYSLDTNQRIQIPQHGPRAARRRPRPCARAR